MRDIVNTELTEYLKNLAGYITNLVGLTVEQPELHIQPNDSTTKIQFCGRDDGNGASVGLQFWVFSGFDRWALNDAGMQVTSDHRLRKGAPQVLRDVLGESTIEIVFTPYRRPIVWVYNPRSGISWRGHGDLHSRISTAQSEFDNSVNIDRKYASSDLPIRR